MCSDVPMPAAPMAAGPSGATMMVSTMPMDIQPSSASTTGSARRSIGASSVRKDDIDGHRWYLAPPDL